MITRMSATTIRRFDAGDADRVVELSLAAWAPVFASFRSVLGEDIYRRVFPEWEVSQAKAVRDALTDEESWVSVTGDRISGFTTIKFDLAERSGEIYMIAVDPAFQRQGIANQLIEFSCAEMKSRGIDLASIATGGDPGHAPARAAYENAGFTPFPQVWYSKLL